MAKRAHDRVRVVELHAGDTVLTAEGYWLTIDIVSAQAGLVRALGRSQSGELRGASFQGDEWCSVRLPRANPTAQPPDRSRGEP